MNDETLGLRERKRLETRAQLERAAVRLAQEVGLENATIDAICASVPVSPRTFFNYFESKEDAVLGVRDIPIDDELVSTHLAKTAHEPLTAQVVGLLLVALGPGIGDTDLHDARRAIIREHPGLLSRQIAQMTRMGEQLIAATSTLLAHQPAFAASSADERNAIAELILPLCGGAVRVAVKEWIVSGDERTQNELSRRAVELAGKAIETLR